jgi:hypothetical protein
MAALLLKNGAKLYELPGIFNRLERQLIAGRLLPKEGIDHRYLEVRGIKGNVMRCNLSGHGPGHVNVFFNVKVEVVRDDLKFTVLGRTKPRKSDRRGETLVSPITGELIR